MDAYRQGLTGEQAAWANRKYHGHRVLPKTILAELGLVDLETQATRGNAGDAVMGQIQGWV